MNGTHLSLRKTAPLLSFLLLLLLSACMSTPPLAEPPGAKESETERPAAGGPEGGLESPGYFTLDERDQIDGGNLRIVTSP